MKIYQRVTARLTRVEEFGLYAEAEGQPILILIPETSWVPIVLRESFSIGDELAVFILRFVPQHQTFLGSLRALYVDKEDGAEQLGLRRMHLKVAAKGLEQLFARIEAAEGRYFFDAPDFVPDAEF